jgi:hypothetical protein
MYIRMTKKQIECTVTFIIILFTTSGLHSQQSVLNLGEEDLWRNSQLNNLILIDGKRGYLDITCSDDEYKPDISSDMILSLNRSVPNDKTGNYSIMNQIEYLETDEAFGNGAAFFDGTTSLLIKAETKALFSTSTLWGDFTLEFRMLPATLKEGATIFLWKGLHKKDQALIPQEIRCTVHNRKLVWDFDNFFINPDDSLDRISLSGDKLIPGIWSHHMITFNSQTGLLEYKINNIPSDNTYTSRSGKENIEFNLPLVGNQQSFPIELGDTYSGLIDEFRISTEIIEFPVLHKFSNSGSLETGIIDLKTSGSKLITINSERSTPGRTSVRYQYLLSNNKSDLLNPDRQWEDFEPSEPINKNGRYIKLRAQLYSESESGHAPVLTNISLVYKEADYPPPPLTPSVEKVGERIKISWNKSINPEIVGYKVYFGEKPGQYISTGSPIDAGKENFVFIEGLESNKRYYFAVTSYKSLNSGLESIFSNEISINP